MKKSLITAALAVVLSAGLAQAPAQAQVPAADNPAAGDSPYAGTSKWRLMSTASDVDGDGTIDGIWIRRKSNKVCSVKVTRGPGRATIRDLYSSWGNACMYHGDAPLDPVKGSEISVITGLGAHTPWHHVLTWRNGRLVVERGIARPRWTIDSTAMYVEGYARKVGKDGTVRLVHNTANRDHGNIWKGQREVYTYKNGRWVRSASDRVVLTEASARSRAGWHVRHLPRFWR